MESLVANYASSDEEEQKAQQRLPKPSLSSLPPPKSQQTRRVVQFKPPISLLPKDNIDKDEDDDEEKQTERKRRRDFQSPAVPSGKSVLSMIPAPKNSLSLGSSSSSSNRRVSVPKDPSPPPPPIKKFAAPPPPPVNYGSDVYVEPMEEVAAEMGREMGRRGGKAKIVEVKQDELMKNRPRQDPTPAATSFGPAYPAVSGKGKPTKLHKRKHQIGSLYFDMRQKESELAERRSKGFLTKAETQAKYGW